MTYSGTVGFGDEWRREMGFSEYVGRYSVRKSLRFELEPVAGTENFVYDAADVSEDLAEGLG